MAKTYLSIIIKTMKKAGKMYTDKADPNINSAGCILYLI